MRLFLRILIVLAVPLVLIVTALRLVCLPWFPRWEYQRANFPADAYGMAPEQRLYLAELSIYFLNMPYDLELLERAQLEDGSPAFNARELRHMADVKRALDGVTLAGALALVVGLAAGWALWRRAGAAALWGALCDGGLLVLMLVLAIGVLMALSWNTFFTGFHRLFFEGDTWLFSHSDTLIRLFPLKLWQDVSLLVVILVVGPAFALALLGRMWQRRLSRVEEASA